MAAVWDLARNNQTYPQLRSDLQVDVAIVGAGITGLFLALKLVDAGQRVAVLEARKIASGATGGSTGNLYGTLSQGLSPLHAKWGAAVTREVVALRRQGVDALEQAVQRFGIDCNFARQPLHFCVTREDATLLRQLEAEWNLASAAGLQADLTADIPGFNGSLCQALRIDGQAQCNPLALVQGLADAVTETGGLIFEESRVVDIDPGKGLVTTTQGAVTAGAIVEATHTPKGINLVQAEMETYREYGVAVVGEAAQLPKGIFWVLDDSVSLRIYEHGGQRYLLAVGEKHKTGQGTLGVGYYQNLTNYLAGRFGATQLSYQWSAQQYRAADLLPYIGRSAHSNVFIATGFAADGLTWGAVAAGIISNQILGRESRGEQLLDPRRFTPTKSAKNWARENATVAKSLVRDYLTPEARTEIAAIPPDAGRLVKVDGEKLAVYRAPDKTLTALSPVCPHMKCHVHWNGADRTWDCPCHGSRFATSGEVLEGPAFEPLPRRTLSDD